MVGSFAGLVLVWQIAPRDCSGRSWEPSELFHCCGHRLDGGGDRCASFIDHVVEVVEFPTRVRCDDAREFGIATSVACVVARLDVFHAPMVTARLGLVPHSASAEPLLRSGCRAERDELWGRTSGDVGRADFDRLDAALWCMFCGHPPTG